MSNFVPEMHDIAKLIPEKPAVPLTGGGSLKSHDQEGPSFRNLDWKGLGSNASQNATWLGIVYHMDHETQWVRDLGIPADTAVSNQDRARLFLLVLADHLAATTGRVLRAGGSGESSQVMRLWNLGYAATLREDAEPIKDAAALREMVQWICADPADAGDYEKNYGESLHRKPEEEGIPRNVTSLYSHSWLTGKHYRVLERHTALKTEPLCLELDEKPASTVGKAEHLWECRLVRIAVHFHQQPVRPADLGIFDRLNEARAILAEKFADNLLFAAGDFMWLFLPPESLLSLQDVFEPLTQRGLFVTAQVLQAPLAALRVWRAPSGLAGTVREYAKRREDLQQQLSSIPTEIEKLQIQIQQADGRIRSVTTDASRNALIESKKQLSRQRDTLHGQQVQLQAEVESIGEFVASAGSPEKQTSPAVVSHYPDSLQPSFDPPLCEICQVRPATAYRVGSVTDYLCDECSEIRDGCKFSQRDLAKWIAAETESERRSSSEVVWVRVALDADRLERAVSALFGKYVDDLKRGDKPLPEADRMQMKTEMRLPALLRDFVEDYQKLLLNFEQRFEKIVGEKYQEKLGTDSWVGTIRRGVQVFELLDGYQQLIKNHFPVLAERGASESPVRLGISIAPAKYPFYQHWRYVSTPPADMSVRVVGKGPLEVSLPAMSLLLEKLGDLSGADWAARDWRTYLHKLAAVAARSGSHALATSTFLADVEARGRGIPRNLYEFKQPLRERMLRVTDLLAYAKVTSWK